MSNQATFQPILGVATVAGTPANELMTGLVTEIATFLAPTLGASAPAAAQAAAGVLATYVGTAALQNFDTNGLAGASVTGAACPAAAGLSVSTGYTCAPTKLSDLIYLQFAFGSGMIALGKSTAGTPASIKALLDPLVTGTPLAQKMGPSGKLPLVPEIYPRLVAAGLEMTLPQAKMILETLRGTRAFGDLALLKDPKTYEPALKYIVGAQYQAAAAAQGVTVSLSAAMAATQTVVPGGTTPGWATTAAAIAASLAPTVDVIIGAQTQIGALGSLIAASSSFNFPDATTAGKVLAASVVLTNMEVLLHGARTQNAALAQLPGELFTTPLFHSGAYDPAGLCATNAGSTCTSSPVATGELISKDMFTVVAKYVMEDVAKEMFKNFFGGNALSGPIVTRTAGDVLYNGYAEPVFTTMGGLLGRSDTKAPSLTGDPEKKFGPKANDPGKLNATEISQAKAEKLKACDASGGLATCTTTGKTGVKRATLGQTKYLTGKGALEDAKYLEWADGAAKVAGKCDCFASFPAKVNCCWDDDADIIAPNAETPTVKNVIPAKTIRYGVIHTPVLELIKEKYEKGMTPKDVTLPAQTTMWVSNAKRGITVKYQSDQLLHGVLATRRFGADLTDNSSMTFLGQRDVVLRQSIPCAIDITEIAEAAGSGFEVLLSKPHLLDCLTSSTVTSQTKYTVPSWSVPAGFDIGELDVTVDIEPHTGFGVNGNERLAAYAVLDPSLHAVMFSGMCANAAASAVGWPYTALACTQSPKKIILPLYFARRFNAATVKQATDLNDALLTTRFFMSTVPMTLLAAGIVVALFSCCCCVGCGMSMTRGGSAKVVVAN